MATPSPSPLAAMFALVIAWFITRTLWMIRTTPGLILITFGYLAGLAGQPWAGLAAALAGAAIYREQCSRTPYAACARCNGTGHHRRRRGRICRPCRGKGVRIRWGRAVMNGYRRLTQTRDQAPAARAARALNPATLHDAELNDTPTTNATTTEPAGTAAPAAITSGQKENR